MKKIFLLGAMVCALGMMTACKSGLKVIKPSLIVSLPTMSIYDNVLSGFSLNGIKLSKAEKDTTVERCFKKRGTQGRSEGRTEQEGYIPLWRSAATPMHCPCFGNEARCAIDGRTHIGS